MQTQSKSQIPQKATPRKRLHPWRIAFSRRRIITMSDEELKGPLLIRGNPAARSVGVKVLHE